MEALEQKNKKAWFEAHRSEYEEQFLKPAQAFVEKLGKEIQRQNSNFIAVPKIDQSIFQSYRDIRFTKKNNLFVGFMLLPKKYLLK